MKSAINFKANSTEDTDKLAARLAETYFKKCDKFVVVLDGKFASGKTYLIKSIVDALGIKEHITSPSFFLKEEYETDSQKIAHYDLYRLDQDNKENYDIIISMISEDYQNGRIVFVEWGKDVWKHLKFFTNTMYVEIKITGETKRSFKVKAVVK